MSNINIFICIPSMIVFFNFYSHFFAKFIHAGSYKNTLFQCSGMQQNMHCYNISLFIGLIDFEFFDICHNPYIEHNVINNSFNIDNIDLDITVFRPYHYIYKSFCASVKFVRLNYIYDNTVLVSIKFDPIDIDAKHDVEISKILISCNFSKNIICSFINHFDQSLSLICRSFNGNSLKFNIDINKYIQHVVYANDLTCFDIPFDSETINKLVFPPKYYTYEIKTNDMIKIKDFSDDKFSRMFVVSKNRIFSIERSSWMIFYNEIIKFC